MQRSPEHRSVTAQPGTLPPEAHSWREAEPEAIERHHRAAYPAPRSTPESDAVSPPALGTKGHGTHRQSPLLRRVLIAVCAAAMVFSGVALIRYGAEDARSRSVSEEMRELYRAEETAAPVASSAATDAAAPLASSAATDTEATAVETAAPVASPGATDAEVTAAETATAAPVQTLAPAESIAVAAAPLRTTTAPYSATGNTTGKFRTLQKKNGEILGWLTIEGVVDEPVVKRDNTFYLTHDALGNRSAAGALFLDQHCSLYPAPENLVIHGHNMKTGAMFGSLKLYKVKGAKFLQQAGLVQLDTVFEEATYAVFAVVVADIRPEKRNFVNFCGALSFSTDAAFEQYIAQIRKLAMVTVPLEVTPADRLLTLSTCSGEDENERLLIFCRKLREDESQLELNYAFAHAVDQ